MSHKTVTLRYLFKDVNVLVMHSIPCYLCLLKGKPTNHTHTG